MKLLGSNDETSDTSAVNRPQIRTSQDDGGAVGYGFPQENEFPAFVKRWPGTDDAIDVNILHFFFKFCRSFIFLLPQVFF